MSYQNQIIVTKMKELGWTVERMADETGLSTQTISRARKGENVGTDVLERILAELNLRLSIEDASRAVET
jgi:uncharacterized protein YerC